MKMIHKMVKMSSLKDQKSTRMDAAFIIHSFSSRRRNMMEGGQFSLELVPFVKSKRSMGVNRHL
jgi:hypothetical protein